MAMLTRQETRAARKNVEPARPPKHSVNLLPPETVERQRSRALVRRFVFAVLALLVVGAGVWLAQASAIQSANDELTSAQSDLASARSRLEPLQAVKAFSASLDGQQQLVGESMARHTSFSRALQGFAAAFPQGTEVGKLDVAVGAPCPGPDTFKPAPAIGCITWTVTVPGEAQVRQLTASLAESPGLVSPFLTGAVQNTQTGGFDATGTVNFDERLLTGRFKDLVKGAAQ